MPAINGRNTRSGTREAKWLPITMPGIEPTSSDEEQRPVDRAEPPMPRAREQRERHGVRDIGADDAHGRHHRIEHQQHRDADRARADRGHRHQHAEDRARALVGSSAISLLGRAA